MDTNDRVAPIAIPVHDHGERVRPGIRKRTRKQEILRTLDAAGSPEHHKREQYAFSVFNERLIFAGQWRIASAFNVTPVIAEFVDRAAKFPSCVHIKDHEFG
jgi:hypothetical protein